MKKIEFVGGVAPELAQVIEDNNIVATCVDGNVCGISDEDYSKLKHVAPAAWDGNDIVDVDVFTVYYNNNVEVFKIKEFPTLEEAKAYCDDETRGYDEVADGDNDYEGRSNNFRYEVYDGEPIEEFFDEDGEVDDEKTVFKEPVYQTKQYYCD